MVVFWAVCFDFYQAVICDFEEKIETDLVFDQQLQNFNKRSRLIVFIAYLIKEDLRSLLPQKKYCLVAKGLKKGLIPIYFGVARCPTLSY